MAYVNNGYWRAYICEVTLRESDGSVAAGYPKQYDIRDEFTVEATTYPALTTDEFSKLSDTDYNNRLDAFRTHVESDNSGLTDMENHVISGKEANGYNATLCPLPA